MSVCLGENMDNALSVPKNWSCKAGEALNRWPR